MIFSEQMNSAINQQIGAEFSASLQYVAIAAYFDLDSLPELARHFYQQAAEERDHAMRFVGYIVDAGGRLDIPQIEEVKCKFPSAEAAVQKALDGEVEVTGQINSLVNLAIQQSDHITQNFLQWFVTEQLEELSTAQTLLRIVQRAGDQLLLVEEYLARRKPAPAADQSVGA